MVLPPTGLTSLLGATTMESDAIFAALRDHGCLTRAARDSPEVLKSLLASVLAAEMERPVMPGPSTTDMIARALRGSTFLSEKGRRLDANPPRRPWTGRWRDMLRRMWRPRRR
jgi:hypothetical protein